MSEHLRPFALLSVALVLTACPASLPAAPGPGPILEPQARCEPDLRSPASPPEGYAALLEANARFAARLYAEAQNEVPAQNVFVSPLSASVALQMLYQGASGSTRSAMAGALGLQGLSLEALNAANAHLRASLASPSGCVSLKLAQSVWLHHTFPVEPGFVTASRSAFDAEVRTLDLRDPSAAPTINTWVRGKTGGMIEQVLDPEKPIQEVFFLINATHFAGAWQTIFDPTRTLARPFTLEDGSSRVVQMMRRTLEGELYRETGAYQMVRLPYKSDGQRMYALELYLPRVGQTLSSALPTMLAPPPAESFVASGPLELPRFRLESELDLKPLLERLGLGVIFTDQADFSGISAVPTLVSKALHRTALEVSEEGTRAAGVTVIGGTPTSAPLPRAVNLVFDRPFFLKIVEVRSGTVLFMGAVYAPSAS